MTLYQLAEAIRARIEQGRGGERVMVRGYEGGLDDLAEVRDEEVYLDQLRETYYGPHVPLDQGGYFQVPADAARARVARLVGSRDDQDVQ